MSEKTSSGSELFDRLLEGGFENDVVTTIYGPAGSGKTTACLLAALSVAASGKKAIYIDTEGGFSITRLDQLTGSNKKVMDNILFLKPTNFDEQWKVIERLKAMANSKIGIVVIDTIANLYRSERSNENAELNRNLGKQVSLLVELVRTKNIPVIMTNQVYSDMEGGKGVKMVGGDIITYNSKCLVELKTFHAGKRIAVLQRHRHLPHNEILFEIKQEGFEEIKDKGFKLF